MHYWRRTLERADDGCSDYQCLACKQHLECPTAPYHAKMYDGSLSEYGYKFCPYCGVQWKGEHDWGYDQVAYPDWGERKTTIFIVWAIQETTVWRQSDGSLKSLSRSGAWEEPIWNTLSYYINAGAIEIKKLLSSYRGQYNYNHNKDVFSDIQTLVRAVVVKPGTTLWEQYETMGNRYHGRAIDFRFWGEYRKVWGGKQHFQERERKWTLKS